jgi:hypothetical protein
LQENPKHKITPTTQNSSKNPSLPTKKKRQKKKKKAKFYQKSKIPPHKTGHQPKISKSQILNIKFQEKAQK